jgi:hypothetical protein
MVQRKSFVHIADDILSRRSIHMHAKWPTLATVLGLGVAYIAYPYATLYRLNAAILSADTSSLESLVDWHAVREGIKEDVCDMVAEEPHTLPGGALPPFGASFVRGIASNVIDQSVTPQALVAMTTPVPPSMTAPVASNQASPPGADVHVTWAFFDSPTVFQISLLASGQTEPIRLEMDLRHGSWRVRRVWLPTTLLSAGYRT